MESLILVLANFSQISQEPLNREFQSEKNVNLNDLFHKVKHESTKYSNGKVTAFM